MQVRTRPEPFAVSNARVRARLIASGGLSAVDVQGGARDVSSLGCGKEHEVQISEREELLIAALARGLEAGAGVAAGGLADVAAEGGAEGAGGAVADAFGDLCEGQVLAAE